jgi:hypothetical protein
MITQQRVVLPPIRIPHGQLYSMLVVRYRHGELQLLMRLLMRLLMQLLQLTIVLPASLQAPPSSLTVQSSDVLQTEGLHNDDVDFETMSGLASLINPEARPYAAARLDSERG